MEDIGAHLACPEQVSAVRGAGNRKKHETEVAWDHLFWERSGPGGGRRALKGFPTSAAWGAGPSAICPEDQHCRLTWPPLGWRASAQRGRARGLLSLTPPACLLEGSASSRVLDFSLDPAPGPLRPCLRCNVTTASAGFAPGNHTFCLLSLRKVRSRRDPQGHAGRKPWPWVINLRGQLAAHSVPHSSIWGGPPPPRTLLHHPGPSSTKSVLYDLKECLGAGMGLSDSNLHLQPRDEGLAGEKCSQRMC